MSVRLLPTLLPPPAALLLGGLLLAASLLAAPVPACAQIDSREGIALQNQILELRHDVQILQNEVSRGGGGGGGAPVRSAPIASGGGGDITAQLLARVDALEEQVRQLRGRIDETANQQQVQNADLTKQIGDLGFQMQTLQGGSGAARPPGAGPSLGQPGQTLSPPPSNLGNRPPAGGTVGAAGSPPPLPVAARRTPELAIQDGNAALARRDYATAEAQARDVLDNNRTSPRSYDAQYLLAEALSGKRDYSQAAIAYDDAYRRSPKGVHAQESLLGLANALTAINEKRAACDTLSQYRASFPAPRADLREAVASASQRAGCR
jgi:TolA-binding protein